MRAHQIMTRPVVSVPPDTTILEAAETMLQRLVSELPVIDAAGFCELREAVSQRGAPC